jgi:hypothetical protein
MPPLLEAIILVLAPFCSNLFAPGLAPCAAPASGSDAGLRRAYGDGCLTSDEVERRAPLHELPLRLEPGHMVRAPGCPDPIGASRHLLRPPGSAHCAESRSHRDRRSGQKISAEGCHRDAVRSTKKHSIRCFGLKRVVMMRLVPVPRSRHVWALPFLAALCGPADKATRRRRNPAWMGFDS